MKQIGPLTSGNEAIEATERSPKMLVLRRLLTLSLTLIAFWNSYAHTVEWFQENGQEDTAHALALIPEGGVFLVILSLALDHLTRPQKWVLGFVALGSVSVTLAGNLAGAGPGWAGAAAALVAPLFAIAGFALELMGESAPSQQAAHEPTVSQPVSHGRLMTGSCVPSGSLGLMVVSRDGSLREPYEPVSQGEPDVWDRESVLRLMSQEGLTTAEAVIRTGLSKATINRWKRKVA